MIQFKIKFIIINIKYNTKGMKSLQLGKLELKTVLCYS